MLKSCGPLAALPDPGYPAEGEVHRVPSQRPGGNVQRRTVAEMRDAQVGDICESDGRVEVGCRTAERNVVLAQHFLECEFGLDRVISAQELPRGEQR